MVVKLMITAFLMSVAQFYAPHKPIDKNKILGQWVSSAKNIVVKVYKNGDEFEAKIVWFNDSDDLSRPMAKRKDIENPEEDLRNRKILGLDIVKNLRYNKETHRWEDGIIYDPRTGRKWSSVVYFNDKGLMEVKGYWHFEFLCKTMTFSRIDESGIASLN